KYRNPISGTHRSRSNADRRVSLFGSVRNGVTGRINSICHGGSQAAARTREVLRGKRAARAQVYACARRTGTSQDHIADQSNRAVYVVGSGGQKDCSAGSRLVDAGLDGRPIIGCAVGGQASARDRCIVGQRSAVPQIGSGLPRNLTAAGRAACIVIWETVRLSCSIVITDGGANNH